MANWPYGLDDSLGAVGPHLRSLRRDRDTTLADLSAETGISVSTLSRLESGDRKPTLELLLPLARSYGVTLDELVDAPPTGDPRIHLRPVEAHGMTMIPLTRRSGGIQAFKMVIPAGPGPAEPPPPDPRGVRVGLRHERQPALCSLRAEHDLVLATGEAAEFDTRTPHWFGAADDDAVEFLSLFGKHGERAHLRARPKTAT